MTQPTRVKFWTVLAAAIASLLGAPSGLAQRGNEVTVEVSDCIEIEAPAARLACFERRVEEAQGGRDPTSAPPSRAEAAPPRPTPAAPAARVPPAAQPAPAARAATPANDDSLGRPRTSRREERSAREQAEREGEEQREELTARVVSVRETIPNNFTITLDNGQVWRQNRPEFYPLRPGHEVRIYPGKLGDSYRLTAPALRGAIQVERVR
jgi:hypothetical protein